MAEEEKTGGSGIESTGLVLAGPTPEIYFNGIEVGLTLSDVRVRAMMHGRPVCHLHMSFTTAKTLAKNLAAAVAALEEMTGRPIMTMDDVEQSLEGSEKK